MNPSSILVFFNPSVRATNDATNHLREIILETILTSPHVEDQDYGIRWRQVRDSWSIALQGITTSVYDRVHVTRKGGRRHNHDFTVEFYQGDRLVDTQQVEFKFGKSMKTCLNSCPCTVIFRCFPARMRPSTMNITLTITCRM
jgi:hypothetical protein